MPVTRSTPNKGGQTKKTTESVADDAQADDQQVEPTNKTAQVEEQQAPAEAGTVQPSRLCALILDHFCQPMF